MKIQGVSWIGIRSERFGQLVSFFKTVGLVPRLEEPGFVMFQLPDGDRIEIFGPTMASHAHFTTGPVAGFSVEDVDAARDELMAAGAELLGPLQREGSDAWQHFRGPDGNIYEINGRAGLAKPD